MSNLPRFKFYWNNIRNNEELVKRYEAVDEEFASAFFTNFDEDMMLISWNSMEAVDQEKVFNMMMEDFKTFKIVPAIDKILWKQNYDGSWDKALTPAFEYFLGDDFMVKAA